MIGFSGLSHLGIVSSAAAASKGCDVLGYDPDAATVASLEAGRLPIHEPDLVELLAASRSRLHFTSDAARLKDCALVYLSRDLPEDAAGSADVSALQRLAEEVAAHAPPGAVLVVLSQAPPGFTRKLAAALGRPDLTLFYQMETLIFGRAVERALRPEFTVVGCADPAAGLPAAYADLLRRWDVPVHRMRYESAELAKIALNLCLASSVTTANTLAELCEAVGADWSEILPALKRDRRIGPHAYLSPGLGIAGGHLERDLNAVRTLAGELGTDAGIVDAILTHSRHRRDWALKTLHAELLSKCDDPIIALWGLAYKPDTDSTRNSPALSLVRALEPYHMQAYDPRVRLGADAPPRFVQAGAPLEACRGADALAVMTPWREFSAIPMARILEAMRGRLVLDPFGALDPTVPAGRSLAYFRLGSPPILRGTQA